MKAMTTLGALGIGAASAVALFAVHRTRSTDGAPSERPVTAAPRPQGGAAAPAGQRGELVARAENAADGFASPGGDGADGSRGDGGAASGAETGSEADEGAANPHIEALSHPSPAYRNVSLATVIQEAGHVCTNVLSSSAAHENLSSWRVSCEGGRAYFVFEDAPGSLRVEPMVYFDSPTPFIRRDSEGGPILVPAPPPE